MPTRRNTKIDALRRVPLFADLTDKQLHGIEAFVDEVEVDAGRVLVDQEGFGNELLIVVDGTAEVTRDGRHIADLGPGEAIGEIALLDGKPRTATVTAKEPMTLVTVSKRAFDTVLDRVPGLPHALLRTLAARLREADLVAYDR
ncbi:MAG TPA: cyclic nucleotide-binding domain-containing protein [Euzebyales bacterium]|nr:cyclic nucleotide-binding domain-containing protein [Euzebyales bacterium]